MMSRVDNDQRQVDSKQIRKSLLASQSQPVKMRVAAALVYHQLTGKTREAASVRDYCTALCTTALAISHIVDVCYVNDQGRLLRVPSDDLALGAFEDYGDVYRARSGAVYRGLTMRRVDLMEAIAILAKAHAAIGGAHEHSAQRPIGV